MPPAARVSDIHTCPIIKGPSGPIQGLVPVTVKICGQPAARLGDVVLCPASPKESPDKIVTGSPTVRIDGLPAARVGDQTTHKGVISVGAPNVNIG